MTVVDGAPVSFQNAADDLRGFLEDPRTQCAGEEMYRVIRELFPIFRSITGEGLRQSLRALQQVAPLTLFEVPSGTTVFDWTVPKEWVVRAARLVAPDGTVIADIDDSNLHLLSYSVPFRGKVALEELEKHLHSVPEYPTLVPYRTSYYKEDWGFCVSHEQRMSLQPGEYDVLIDTSFTDGALTYGEVVVPGAQADEVLISAHSCHPSLANDNLSAMVLAATLARILAGFSPRYTYRFVFLPGTIGSITWLSRNEEAARRVAHGLVIASVGDHGRLTYKRTRDGKAEIDRAVAHVLTHSGEEYQILDFFPWGGDERQYCSPGFDLPVGSLGRTIYPPFREFHTSADDLSFVSPEMLTRSLRRYLEVFEVLEANRTCISMSPYGEPELGRRGLYGSGRKLSAMLWTLNLSDGEHCLLDIADRANMPFPDIHKAAAALERGGLLAVRSQIDRPTRCIE